MRRRVLVYDAATGQDPLVARYEFNDGKSSKFWEIVLDGDTFTTRFGRIGTDGQSSTKVFSSDAAARKEHDKLVASKVKKGYALVEDADVAPGASSGPETALEQAIFEQPNSVEAWQVYGDWLQTQGDPRGEIVALEVTKVGSSVERAAELQEQIDRLIAQHRAEWLEPDIIGALEQDEDLPLVELEWRYGFIWKATARMTYDAEGPSVEQSLKMIMKSSASRFIHEVSIGLTDADGEVTFNREITALAKSGKRPSVRRVTVGDFEFPEETEISWTEVGSVEKLYPVFPHLEWLKVQGGSIELGTLHHKNLETLILHTGGLPAAAARALGSAVLPRLHTLEVWFGDEDYGGEVDIDMLDLLLMGKGLPCLKRLGLENAAFTDELPVRVADSALLPQLKQLSFAMGTMTDRGAEALLDRAEAFAHLEQLIVDDNFLSEDAVASLRRKFGDALVSGEQKEPEDDDFTYVSVSE